MAWARAGFTQCRMLSGIFPAQYTFVSTRILLYHAVIERFVEKGEVNNA